MFRLSGLPIAFNILNYYSLLTHNNLKGVYGVKKKNINKEPSVEYIRNEKNDSIDLVNKYGTYEIQPTADTNNQYPAIAQGYNKKIIKTDCENPKER